MTSRRLIRQFLMLLSLPLATAAFAQVPAAAQPLACPAPGALVQVAPCLPEAELRMEYIGYCSDNRRMYAGDTETCSSFESYVRVKHAALWESPDGAFQGYLSCTLAAGAMATLPPAALSITRQGTVTRVVCRYGEAASVVHRTKARCALQDAVACKADAATCRARCE